MFVMKETSRYIAIFVVAFLCLNLGGALCLTHCALERISAEDEFAGLSEHCKAIKLAEKADSADSEGNTAADTNFSVCCSVPVALVAAPIEKRTEFEKVAAVALVPQIANIPIVPASRDAEPSIPVYRPPPLDRRGDRLLHCVIIV
jgi:hypothetical protein